jgi:hypothetical protein
MQGDSDLKLTKVDQCFKETTCKSDVNFHLIMKIFEASIYVASTSRLHRGSLSQPVSSSLGYLTDHQVSSCVSVY